MSKLYIIILPKLFLFFSVATYAQNHIDTLQNKNFEELKNLYYNYIDNDSIKTKAILKIYLEKATKNKDTFHIAEVHLFMHYNINSGYDITHLDKIITLTQDNPSIKYPAYAYFKKAQYFLYQERNIEKTLINLNKAKSYFYDFNNPNLSTRVDYLIGIVKNEHLGEKKEAISIFKKCAQYYINNPHGFNKYRYLYSLHAIAETYISLEKYDSVNYYNNLGYKTANKYDENELMKYYFSLCEGINHYAQNNFFTAIDSITIALPKMIILEDKSNLIDSYFYLAKSYYDIGNKEKAIHNFKKTDSILETLSTLPQYKHVKTYEYLKNHYTEIKDIEKRNYYLNKLNTVLDKYLNDKIFINKKVREDYDVPKLLDEQKKIINKLNKKNNIYVYGILCLFIILFGLAGIAFYQNKKKKLYRLRFEKLINDQNNIPRKSKPEVSNRLQSNLEIKVPEKHIESILNKLEDFEKTNAYLSQGISVQSLADQMETNVKYLSQVINHYKKKKFTTYINELRISYAVNKLKENPTLRKFTIKAIAHEMGYSSAETFSNAFYKQLAIKPSFFLKELEKSNL